MVDTLRGDYLGYDGFSGPISPNADVLAAESIVYDNCFAQSPWTKPSIASLFTSLYPQAHGITNHEGKYWGGDGLCRYPSGVRAFDRRLGGFLEFLRDAGLLDNAIVILTSDHGEELFEHGGWSHGQNLYDEALRVPLLIRQPRARDGGTRVTTLVELVDLMPTLLSLVGLAAPGRLRAPTPGGCHHLPDDCRDADHSHRHGQRAPDCVGHRPAQVSLPTMRPRRIGITGSTGYVGSSLATHLRTRGWSVVEMGRGVESRGPERIHFALDSDWNANRLAGLDGLVHCAYDFAPRTAAEVYRVNVEGSARLFAAARTAGVETCVTISTMSAFEGARSLYGRAKLEIETVARTHGAAIIRPGLIWDESGSGLLGAIARAVVRLPVLPIVAADRQVLFPAQIEDLCALIDAILAGDVDHGTAPIIAAAPEALSLRELVGRLAAAKRRQPLILPVPYGVVDLGLRTAEALGLRLPFRSDSLRSLVGLEVDRIFTGTADETGRFRPFLAEAVGHACQP